MDITPAVSPATTNLVGEMAVLPAKAGVMNDNQIIQVKIKTFIILLSVIPRRQKDAP